MKYILYILITYGWLAMMFFGLVHFDIINPCIEARNELNLTSVIADCVFEIELLQKADKLTNEENNDTNK